MRVRPLLVASFAIPLVAGVVVMPASNAASAALLSTTVNQKVIVVFKDQVPQDPASRAHVSSRRQIEASDQASVLSLMKQSDAKNVHSYTSINAVSATVSAREAAQLKANTAVAEVVPDQIIRISNPFDTPSSASPDTVGPSRTPLAGTCATNPAKPELEPQALSAINADSSTAGAKTARSLGLDGAGTTVAFIADGLDINNQDFIRPDGSHVFTDFKDFSGEGTGVPTGGGEAFLDASSIAAQGLHSYNISDYSALPLSKPCYIRIEGVAPGASLVGLDIFGAEDAGFNSEFLEAIDYAVSVDHVNVLNESLGNNYYPDDQASLDLVKQANDEAVAAGTTVTVSSGDAGVTSTIGTPATDPNVISAGASTTYETPSQLGYAGFQFNGLKGYLNNNISALSSSGFTQSGATISLVAPGELNWALCTANLSLWSECTNFQNNPSPIQESGGTSESAPLTAGAAALVIQAYERTHSGNVPTPALVKQFLTSTATDIDAPADLQGSGLLNAYAACLAAEEYKAPGPSDSLLESSSQFNAVGLAGSSKIFDETLTNEGTSPVTVKASSRELTPYSQIFTKTVTLSDSSSPQDIDYQGFTDNYAKLTFTVPSGIDRLNASIAYQGASSALSSRVRMTLIDPNGRLADYSLPQGVGNYGDAEVADPVGGTWTAYIWSRDTAGGGSTGKVLFGASTATYQSFGTLSGTSVTVPAGGSASVSLTVATPSTPGDYAGSLVLAPTGQPQLAVPVTLRTLAPTGSTSFTDVLTGGNGRAAFTGVTKYYQVSLPSGEPALNATIELADNPNNQTAAWLIDPSGQAQAFQTNGVLTEDNKGELNYTNTLGTNVHVLDPKAGTWTLIVVFAPTVSGTALSEPFSVGLNETPATVSVKGMPTAPISVNHPAVVKVTVKNTGVAPEAYFVDGREDTASVYDLPAVDSPTASVPLSASGNIPVYLVPSETEAIEGLAKTTGSEPIQFDLGAPSGDPDIASGKGTSVSALVTGTPLSAGEWDIAPDVVGPFGTSAAKSETVTTSLVAETQTFDPAISSNTGDLWQTALGGPLTVSPVVVQPGHSATIVVTISPTGSPGTKVTGTLYLDDDSLVSVYGSLAPNGNTISAIPYSYTVGG